ncbi:MAG: hypothetical protein LH630_05790, partial [Actinomycetia bacterium]|nr:hypothetical protein [Actinomycetes bacterium]
AMRRYRWLVISGFALVPFAFLLGGPGLLLVFGCSWLFRSQVRVPGFSGPDSVVWRATRQLRLDPGSGVATAGNPDRGWIALAVIGGGVIGSLIGALLMPLVQGLGDWAVVGAWLGPLVLCAGFAYQAASRWSRSRQRRARLMTRKEFTRKEAANIGPCQCWNTTALADEVADAYTKRHLLDSGFDVNAANMTTAFGRRVRLLRCPSLGTIWLSADLTAEGASLLMRGDGGTAESAGDAEVGFYL